MIKKKKILIAEEMPEFQASIDAMPADSKIFVDKSMEIAQYIYHLMELKGMKQKDLAEAMGKSEAEVSKMLGGMHNLTLRSIAKLEAALGSGIVNIPKKEKFPFKATITYKPASVISKFEKKRNPKMKYSKEGTIIKMGIKNAGRKNNMNQAI
jgi:transcriptional regulator with XRE-family HTH domain